MNMDKEAPEDCENNNSIIIGIKLLRLRLCYLPVFSALKTLNTRTAQRDRAPNLPDFYILLSGKRVKVKSEANPSKTVIK